MRELFSRRNRDRSQDPDVYTHLDFSEVFRNQSFHIIRDVVRTGENERYGSPLIENLCSYFAREKGLKYLPGNFGLKERRLSATKRAGTDKAKR